MRNTRKKEESPTGCFGRNQVSPECAPVAPVNALGGACHLRHKTGPDEEVFAVQTGCQVESDWRNRPAAAFCRRFESIGGVERCERQLAAMAWPAGDGCRSLGRPAVDVERDRALEMEGQGSRLGHRL